LEEAEGRRVVYPFTAIVGQELAKLSLLCVAVNPTIGGVLLSGDKGTGKSTMVRALADLLPEIEVVDSCPFNCNPHNPLEMCDECYKKYVNDPSSLKIVKRKMRVVDLPLSITVDRLVGTLDIRKALKEGIRGLEPGLLAEANRNILYIDEVNLLDDYIADVLLDSAAMGWNIIEREGVSVKHPARFILVGSMNPEEGELRPQILDRFGLYVRIEAVKDPELRIEIVKRVEEFHSDPISFYRKYLGEQEKLREKVIKAREILNKVEINDDLLKILIDTITEMGIKTHRAEIITVKTAKTIAALDGRTKVNLDDLKKAMELALPHRLRAKPFEQPNIPIKLPPESTSKSKKRDVENKKSDGGASESKFHLHTALGNEAVVFEPEDREVLLKFERKSQKFFSDVYRYRGSRDEKATVINYPHGYPVSYIQPCTNHRLLDVDISATICCASLRSRGLPIQIDDEDIRVRVRKNRVPRLTVIILDSSGSMAVMKRISLAKTLCMKLIEESYVKRDSLSLICFRGYEAEIVVPITRLYSHVINALKSVPTGGRTPLSSALYKLLILARCFRLKNKNGIVRAILITDGKANVSMYGKPIEEEIEILSKAMKRNRIKLEIYDTRFGIEFAKSYIDLLASLLDAPVYKGF